MKKQFTKEEKLIQFFNDKFENSDTNEILICKNDISQLNMSEQEVARIIHIFQEDGLLRIKTKSPHNNFSMPWTISLKSSCLNYFENQKNVIKTKRIKFFNEFRAWVTLLIALVSLIYSLYSANSKNVSLDSVGLDTVPSVSDNQVHTP